MAPLCITNCGRTLAPFGPGCHAGYYFSASSSLKERLRERMSRTSWSLAESSSWVNRREALAEAGADGVGEAS